MNSLDSRYLRLGDTFAHRFVVAETYHYMVEIPGGLALPGHHRGFEIVVAAEPGPASKTHYVTVSYDDNGFSVEPERLEIKHNDVILWSTNSAAAPGFAVRGESKSARFDSAEMPANSMYSHAFGSVGTFEWSSVHDAKLSGAIDVAAHPLCHTEDDRRSYMRKLAEAVVVMIDGSKAHPKKVSITLGQTVFFAVRSGSGVAVVDRTLLAAARFLNPQPLPP